MGLDMYLYVEKYFWETTGKEYSAIVNALEIELPDGRFYPHLILSLETGYWRKANQIHHWFIENLAGGKDDCERIPVNIKDLKELRNKCEKVLNDHSLAENLLPSHGGFFFGTTDYDEWYFKDVEKTIGIIDYTIQMVEAGETIPELEGPFKNAHIYYQASW